jgi:putative transposase
VIDFVATWSAETELPATRLAGWLGLGASKYFARKQRYGKVNEHHETVPRDHWLEPWEQAAIVAVRPKTPLSLEDARRVVGAFVEEYNTRRLHSAIGYVTPHDRLAGRHTQIWEDRDRKLEAARARRAARREEARCTTPDAIRA